MCLPSRAPWVTLCLLFLAGCNSPPNPDPKPTEQTRPPDNWCAKLPRPANASLPSVPVSSQWFQVYLAADGVYALVEPFQFQETISYLIVGSERALMFDTGLGLVPIRPVVEELTSLPVEVLNSHTHYDHVGGNAEFDTILALDTPYTRANMAGFPHSDLAGEVVSSAFCDGPPQGLDPEHFRTRPWRATSLVSDGQKIDLGGRTLEILQVPGHTPDALAILDRANGLLWTGDTFYDGGLWLFVPETNLDHYQKSLARLVGLTPGLRQLLPAHNTASVDPGRLQNAADAVAQVRSGVVPGTPESEDRMVFEIDGVTILTARPVLEGRKGDPTRGGSGLTTWR